MNGREERESCFYTEVEERGHTGYIEPRKQTQRTTACCLAANPICLLSHHLHRPQRARERARERDGERENGRVNVPHVDTAPRHVILIAYRCMRGVCVRQSL